MPTGAAINLTDPSESTIDKDASLTRIYHQWYHNNHQWYQTPSVVPHQPSVVPEFTPLKVPFNHQWYHNNHQWYQNTINGTRNHHQWYHIKTRMPLYRNEVSSSQVLMTVLHQITHYQRAKSGLKNEE